MSLIRNLVVLIGLLMSIICCGDQSMPPLPANSCYVIRPMEGENIKANFDYGRVVVPLFDQFARSRDFSEPSAESSGGQKIYRKVSDGIQIGLTFGIGELSAVAALYSDQDNGCAICREFDQFVRHDVSREFEVLSCNEVPGFSVPELWNVDLRKAPTATDGQ